MYDPTITRQVFNVGLSVTSMKNRDMQFRRAARRSKERMKKYVMDKELGLALVEAETAAHKLDMAKKYRAVAEKLHFIAKEFSKAEANKSFDEDLKKMINVVDLSVRSMDIEKMERAIRIYENYFKGTEDSLIGQGEGQTSSLDQEEPEAKKSRAEELLEVVIREVSRKRCGSSRPVVVPALAMNLAKKERPVVEEIIREYEQDKHENPQIDLIASSLLRRSSIFLPEFEI